MADLSKVMNAKILFDFNIFGQTIYISDSIVMMWIVMAVLIVSSYIFTRKLRAVPEGKQNFAEVIVEFVNNFAKENIGHHWRSFAPYLGTILLFLVFANTSAIFSILPTGEELFNIFHLEFFKHIPEFTIDPPTKDIYVASTMGMMTILVVLGSAIRFKGIFGWIKGFAKPSPIMIPFNIMDYGTRTLSLSMRLFGNILAAFIFMQLIYSFVAPIIPAVFSIYFDLFDGILQAYIFVFLTSIYISEAVE